MAGAVTQASQVGGVTGSDADIVTAALFCTALIVLILLLI
jgi:hypothetical protein